MNSSATGGSGYIPLYRCITGNWLWQEKPFSKGQAWIDLLLLANYKDSKMPYKGKIIEVKRGTVNRSITYLADRWGWSRDKARRFLKLLQNDGMVFVEATTHKTTITIINYENFQLSSATGKAANKQQTNSKPTTKRKQTATSNKVSKAKKENQNKEDPSKSDIGTEQTADEIAEATDWFDSL